jgi:hypothetical protein
MRELNVIASNKEEQMPENNSQRETEKIKHSYDLEIGREGLMKLK